VTETYHGVRLKYFVTWVYRRKDSRVSPSVSDTDAHELGVPTADVDNSAMIPGGGISDANPP